MVLCFGNRAYPWTHVDELFLILRLNIVLTKEQKFDILDDFAHRVKNVELYIGRNCEHAENIVGLV